METAVGNAWTLDVSYSSRLGKNLLFLKSDKFGVRSLVFSFFPGLENPFCLPSCPAFSAAPSPSAQLVWKGGHWEAGLKP